MDKRAVSYGGIKLAILVTLLIFGGLKLYNNTEINQDLKADILSQFPEKKWEAAVFVKTLDDLSPSFIIGDRPIYGVTEFPFFGTIHTLVIVLLMAVVSFFLHLNRSLSNWMKIGIVLLMIPVGYYLGSWLIWFGYNWSAAQFSIPPDQALELRRTYSSGFDNIYLPLLIVSAFGVLSIWGALKKNWKRVWA